MIPAPPGYHVLFDTDSGPLRGPDIIAFDRLGRALVLNETGILTPAAQLPGFSRVSQATDDEHGDFYTTADVVSIHPVTGWITNSHRTEGPREYPMMGVCQMVDGNVLPLVANSEGILSIVIEYALVHQP